MEEEIYDKKGNKEPTVGIPDEARPQTEGYSAHREREIAEASFPGKDARPPAGPAVLLEVFVPASGAPHRHDRAFHNPDSNGERGVGEYQQV